MDQWLSLAFLCKFILISFGDRSNYYLINLNAFLATCLDMAISKLKLEEWVSEGFFSFGEKRYVTRDKVYNMRNKYLVIERA
jgi:hypothetical protein